MEDYKERMKKEYQQLTEQMVRLQNLITKYRNDELSFEMNCPIGLLDKQLSIMKQYMEVLEKRAWIEGVSLEFDMKGE